MSSLLKRKLTSTQNSSSNPFIFKRSELLNDIEDHQLDQALQELDKVKPLDRKQLGEVRDWISTQAQDWTDTILAYCLPAIAITICIVVNIKRE